MDETIYINGRLLPRREAKVSVLDRGFLYGEGLFETMRVYGGRVFRLREHLERISSSSSILGIPFKLDMDGLKRGVEETVEANGLKEGRVRLSLSRGEGYPELEPSSSPTLVILTNQGLSYEEELYRNGFKTIIVKIRANERSPLSRIKSMNFLPHLLAKMEAKSKGVDEGIVLNTEGFVAEGTSSNIFLVKDKSLITPSEECGILPGITRKAILELSPKLGLSFYEKKFPPGEMMKADEAFLTNSLMEIMPLSSIDGTPIGDGRPGRITRKTHQAYRELVEKELGDG